MLTIHRKNLVGATLFFFGNPGNQQKGKNTKVPPTPLKKKTLLGRHHIADDDAAAETLAPPIS